MMNLTSRIKEYALNIGFVKAGITTMENLDFFEQELQRRGEDYTPWFGGATFSSDPKTVFPEGKSIIIVAYDYAVVDFPENLKSIAGRAYLSRSYKPLDNSIHGARVHLFTEFLKENGCKVKCLANELPLRQLAARAGVTSFGRNNFAYVDGVGSFVILYGFIVDKILEYDAPSTKSKCPKECRKCIDACPTKALNPYRLDPNRCIGFNNWMRRGDGSSRFDTKIPMEIRKDMGMRIHGCDLCQEACPRNKNKVEGKFTKDPFLKLLEEHINLKDLLLMTDEYYENWVYPIMYNYIPAVDKCLLQRNAAIAIGNTKDSNYVDVLEQALTVTEPTVRCHIAWALGHIGGKEAFQVLQAGLSTETDRKVLAEMNSALNEIGLDC